MNKKIIGICICMLLITTTLSITGSVTARDEKNPEVKNSNERSFHISTSGLTKIKGNRYSYFTILGSTQPWPDQTYSALFGYINYKDGNTTIYNNNTDETIHKDGEHIVVFYKFYGPILRYQNITVAFEGDAVFAKVFRGW